MTLQATVVWIMTPTGLQRRQLAGPPPPPPPTVDRDLLVYGTYKPNTPDVVGILPDVPRTPVYPTSGNVIVFNGVSTPIEDQEFWGQVDIQGTVVPTFKNCAFYGMDPAVPTASGVLTGNLNLISGPRCILYDCLVSSGPWTYAHPNRPLAAAAVRAISPMSAGIHGGNFDAYRVEICDVQDGVNYTTGTGSTCLMESCWIHRGWYQNGWTGPGSPGSQDTHTDAFQFNRGKDIVIQHCVIGGPRNVATYNLAPPNAYNSGDDFRQDCFMIAQEVSNGPNDKIERVLIDSNWLYGGTVQINHYYRSTWPNTFADMTISNNKFGQRQAGDGWYVLRSPQIQSVYTNNTIEETGAPVPITVGASGP